MKRFIVTVLIVVALLSYGRALWVILGGSKLTQTQDTTSLVVDTHEGLWGTATCSFTSVKRSPFDPSAPKPKIKKRSKPKPKAKPKVEVKKPRISIAGIMWSKAQPLAMLTLPNGSTQMVKVGDEILGRITVKRIDQNRVQILYKETLFWIER